MSLTYSGYENFVAVLLQKPNLRDVLRAIGPTAFDVQLNASRTEVAHQLMSIRAQATIYVSREVQDLPPGEVYTGSCYLGHVTLKAGTATATATVYDDTEEDDDEIVAVVKATAGTQRTLDFNDYPAKISTGVFVKVQGDAAHCSTNIIGVNNYIYPLPTQFWIPEAIYYNGSTTRLTQLGTADEYFKKYTTEQGTPQYFFIGPNSSNVNKIHFLPKPDDDTAYFTVWYFRDPVALSSSSTTCDLPDDDQIMAAKHCAWMLAPMVNKELVQLRMNDFLKSMDARRKNKTRIAGPMPVMRKWDENPRRGL